MADPWLLAAPGDLRAGATVELDTIEAHHVTAVLRLRSGTRIVLADGQGATAGAVLRVSGRGRCTAEVEFVETAPHAAQSGVDVALAVLHGRTMDWAVQKSVEVGVRCLLPLLATRSQLPRAAAERRLAHWRGAARQAIKQCHRPLGMIVADPVTLPELVERRAGSGGLVADPAGIHPRSLPPDGPRLLVVGPEGGLTTDEQRLLDPAQWPRVWLGPHVLRAETAAIAGASLLMVMG